MLRVNAENCTIEKLDCDGNWQQWWPITGDCTDEEAAARVSQIRGMIQAAHGINPDPAEAEPAAGTCVSYDLFLPGNTQVLLPVHVDGGDVITITNARGGVSEYAFYLGAFGFTFPPSGVPDGHMNEDDPAPDVAHMKLIMNVGGLWYDGYNTELTVPAGVSQENVIFMVNDSNIGDNVGNHSFHVEICKAEEVAYTWTHLYDFRTVSNGFTTNGQFSGRVDGHGWWYNDNGSDGLLWKEFPQENVDGIVKAVTIYFDPLNEPPADTKTGFYGGDSGVPEAYQRTAPFPGAVCYIDMSDNVTVDTNRVGAWFHPMGHMSGDLTYISAIRISGTGTDPFIEV